MKQKEITKTENLFTDRCKECDQEITGYSEAQVNSRMSMHMRSHGKSSTYQRGKHDKR